MPVEYKSSEQFCNAAKTEYEYEFGRNASLDNKVSMTLAFCGAVLIFLIDDRGYLDIRSLWSSDALIIFRCLCILFQLGCLALFGLCIFKLFGVLRPREYRRLVLTDLLDKSVPEWKPEQAYMYLGGRYLQLVEKSRSVNNARSEKFGNSIKWLLIAILLCFFNEVIKLNIL